MRKEPRCNSTGAAGKLPRYHLGELARAKIEAPDKLRENGRLRLRWLVYTLDLLVPLALETLPP